MIVVPGFLFDVIELLLLLTQLNGVLIFPVFNQDLVKLLEHHFVVVHVRLLQILE